MLLINVVANAEPLASAEWWSYLAAYDAGPGSIRLDMSLRQIAPVKGFPHHIVTGVRYTSRNSGCFLFSHL